MTKALGLLFGLLLTTSISFGQQSSQFFEASDAVFSTFVSEGKVDYKALKANSDRLDKALSLAKDMQPSTGDLATYKAFWINAYNLAVLKGVINHLPIDSPLEVSGFFDAQTFALGGTVLTLNDIENKKLRPLVKDARIHFVLVCGAKGCPPIISQAYTPTMVNQQLEQQTVKALNDSSFIQLTEGVVVVSEIFKWYNEDFVTTDATVIDFINKFRKQPIPDGTVLEYGTYNWKLNQL